MTTAKKNPARARSMPLSEARGHLLGEPGVRIEYEKLLFREKLATQLEATRKAAGLSQGELAERMGTKQPAVARLESPTGATPSLAVLGRAAEAMGRRLVVSFEETSA